MTDAAYTPLDEMTLYVWDKMTDRERQYWLRICGAELSVLDALGDYFEFQLTSAADYEIHKIQTLVENYREHVKAHNAGQDV